MGSTTSAHSDLCALVVEPTKFYGMHQTHILCTKFYGSLTVENEFVHIQSLISYIYKVCIASGFFSKIHIKNTKSKKYDNI